MAWTTPTAQSYSDCGLHPAEFAAILAAVTTDGTTGAEVLAKCVTELVNHVRGVLATGGRTLGEAGTVPVEIMMTFTALLRRSVWGQLPDNVSRKFFNENRKQEALEAVAYLEQVAKSSKGMSMPSPAAPESEQIITGDVVFVGDGPSAWSAAGMDGL